MEIKQFLENIRKELNLKNLDELALKIGTTRANIDKWVYRKKIPLKWKVVLDNLVTNKSQVSQDKGVIIKGNHINGMANSQIAIGEKISISSTHSKNVSDDEDELLESYRSLPKELREVYLHRIKADAIEYRLRRNINE